jgi:hypothetical protein
VDRGGVTSGTREPQAPVDAPRRVTARRIGLTRSIRYPPGARMLRTGRILRVNLAGYLPARPTTSIGHACSSSGVSAWIVGRVVLVARLVRVLVPGAGAVTTAMLHRRGSDHGDAPSWWLRRGPVPDALSARGAGASAEAHGPSRSRRILVPVAADPGAGRGGSWCRPRRSLCRLYGSAGRAAPMRPGRFGTGALGLDDDREPTYPQNRHGSPSRRPVPAIPVPAIPVPAIPGLVIPPHDRLNSIS